MKLRMPSLQADAYDFAPDILRLQHQPPSPMPRAVLLGLLALFFCLLLWAALGRLDIIAVAQGKLAPPCFAAIGTHGRLQQKDIDI